MAAFEKLARMNNKNGADMTSKHNLDTNEGHEMLLGDLVESRSAPAPVPVPSPSAVDEAASKDVLATDAWERRVVVHLDPSEVFSTRADIDWENGPIFIEKQFPVALLSKEAQKERKAGASQTLTGLGKWWGRKPLVLVRATILGCLLPATDKPLKDRELFLRLMRMDNLSIYMRQKNETIKPADIHDGLVAKGHAAQEIDHWLEKNAKGQWIWSYKRTPFELLMQKASWFEERYQNLDDRIQNAKRPEEVDDTPYPDDLWDEIETHWGVRCSSLADVVERFGILRFGHRPKVGDCFCGGGSIPFEAARIGCDAFASDLNPVAGLLTWGALNIVGGGPFVKKQVEADQAAWLAAVDAQITAWGIEHDGKGRRADAYLYCSETTCPSCEWMVPMSPSWEVSQKQGLGMRLIEDVPTRGFVFELAKGAAISEGTVKDGKLACPHCQAKTPIATIRGDYVERIGDEKISKNKLRQWSKTDFKPTPTDIYQERLYCIRWVALDGKGQPTSKRYYAAPTPDDMNREALVETLLAQNFTAWQAAGCIPNMQIMLGEETSRLYRERGWTHWHHLFNPRQLLFFGFFNQLTVGTGKNAVPALLIGRGVDWNSKLVHWLVSRPGEGNANTFANQALNPMWNFCSRAGELAYSALKLDCPSLSLASTENVTLKNAVEIDSMNDMWITDPPYADAVNYHELTEFFISWLSPHFKKFFSEWTADSRRDLAVRGADMSFTQSMAKIYSNLNKNMPPNGMQVLMFTHQDAEVWASLGLLIWASGLTVSSAWVISTETSSGLKVGSFVKGTVCLVLRKRGEGIDAWSTDLQDLPIEVERQISFLRGLDNALGSTRDFTEADYQLSAYAAALKIVTGFNSYEGITPTEAIGDSEKGIPVDAGATQQIMDVIKEAQAIANGLLIPHMFSANPREWSRLSGVEKFWVKSLYELYAGSNEISVFQTISKAFVFEAGDSYQNLFSNFSANAVMLMTPSEWANGSLVRDGQGWKGSRVRVLLAAIKEVSVSKNGMTGVALLQSYFSNLTMELPLLMILLRLIESAGSFDLTEAWTIDAASAGILANTIAQQNASTIGVLRLPDVGVERKAKSARVPSKGSGVSTPRKEKVKPVKKTADGSHMGSAGAAGFSPSAKSGYQERIDSLLNNHRDKNGDLVL